MPTIHERNIGETVPRAKKTSGFIGFCKLEVNHKDTFVYKYTKRKKYNEISSTLQFIVFLRVL